MSAGATRFHSLRALAKRSHSACTIGNLARVCLVVVGALTSMGVVAAATPAEPGTYLADVVAELQKQWPTNRIVNIVCHGHSVPAGYFRTPVLDSLNAYTHLMAQGNHPNRRGHALVAEALLQWFPPR